MIDSKFNSTFSYKLIYVFRINDGRHNGCLKIGDATIHTSKRYDQIDPNSHDLNYAARKRIDTYTTTAGIGYELLYTEIACYKDQNPGSESFDKVIAFRDYKVHDVLKRSGVKVKYFDTNKKQNEWFITDLETAKNAIKAVKEGRTALSNDQISQGKNPIIFRPEQKEAIEKTINRFKTNNKMLWNAKMRFGKTLTALQVVKEMGFKKTIIITHRPVVNKGWYEDFEKIFYDRPDYIYGSKTIGHNISTLLNKGNNIVYFASMQDLRGSDAVGGNYDKNNEIFKIDWDFVVVDEAHEGTRTKLGQNVLEAIIKGKSGYKTYVLELSGTPFNLLTDYEQDSIYTWDYIMEQEAKENWIKEHFCDSNPYEELPRMNIFTYHLEKSLPVYIDVEDKAFNFKEFFKIWTGDIRLDFKPMPSTAKKDTFMHEDDVKAFLDLICKLDDNTNYPFSTDEYRDFFRHSLWVVPGVKEAKALAALLRDHHIFSHFTIVNVAGEGDEEIDTSDALSAVKDAMTNNPNDTYTITLSCGRLTTGVSVPEWTAVLMLSGTYSTAASQYLQTIFRVQTPANINGKMKENCYVFDFAPDRTLKMVAESVQLSAKAGKKNVDAEITLGKFLNYCPVISIDGSEMKEFKVAYLLQELKKAYAERVARNGFDDIKIYNDELLKLTEVELKDFEDLKKIVGASKQTKKQGDIDINNEGFSDEEIEKIEKIKNKPKKELTEEEKKRLEEYKEKKKNRDAAISNLRAISIRMPLLVYGMDMDIDADITIDNFADNIDELSWNEFMPQGVTKEVFKEFTKYYDKDIFIAASRRIRYISKAADELEPTERVKKIAELFATFKNPDKETVLTPWRVVNMHLSDTIGGYDFYDKKHEYMREEPIFIEREKVTKNIFNKDSKILEINSKSGLYPLYVTYSLFRERIGDQKLSFEEQYRIWDEIIEQQVFVICKTKMAKSITKRTLLGYREGKTNMHAFDDLIMQLKDKPKKFLEKVQSKVFWNIGGNDKMKFNAIVGNPPYQQLTGGAQAQATPLYNYFVESSIALAPHYISLIMPSRWMTGGMGLDEFRKKMLHDERLVLIHDYFDASECFSNVEIKGGVCYFLWNNEAKVKNCRIITHKDNQIISDSYRPLLEEGVEFFIRNEFAISILRKVKDKHEKPFTDIISSQRPFGLPTNFKEYHEKRSLNDIKVYGNKYVGYVDSDYKLIKGDELVSKFKVFTPKAVGSGKSDDVINPIIGEPNSICTETYIAIGNYNTLKEAQNLVSYIDTKFFHFLLTLRKNTQDCLAGAFVLIPMQDFSQSWNDKKLYSKYGLTQDEIEIIENTTNKKIGNRFSF